MSSVIVDLKQVGQWFRTGFWLKRVQILKSITFQIPSGCVFGFLGPNGAGKTTLIRLITGLRTPTSGEVRIFGHEAASLEARSQLGYLPERPYFNEHLTGEGLLQYFGALAGLSASQIRARTPTILNLVGMAHARRLALKKYSKGMLQRIGIAQALLHDPPLLILDEPMSGLDPLGRKEMRELMLRLVSEGKTIFFSSHIIPDVEAICDQVALIHRGQLMGCGSIGSLLIHGVLRTEIGFQVKQGEFLEKDWPEFESIVPMPKGFRGIVGGGQECVQKVLSRLIQNSLMVLWVHPLRQSLEDFFAEFVRQEAECKNPVVTKSSLQ